jgi:hypothetical protein
MVMLFEVELLEDTKMPYKLVKSGSGYKVKTKTGKKRTHSKKPLSHAMAVRQLRALYANTKD